MRRVGFFKRIGRPVNIAGRTVNTNDVIKADFDFIMEQREGGWLYINPNQQQKPKPQQQPVVPPIKPTMPAFEPEIIKTDSSESMTSDENDSIKSVMNLYESIENERKLETEKASSPPVSIEVNIDKLRELKKLSNKEWFAVKKDQCIKLLTDANIDFSHVPKEKWELIKFIKGIIKDL